MVKFGLEFVPMDLFWKTTYYAIQAEKGNFDNLWITDHFTNRSVYASLTMILVYTEKITVGTGVTNPYVISPLATAGALASLNEIAPGRVICGIGVGDRTTLEQAGIPSVKPLAAIRESVEIIRKMTNNEGVSNFEGQIFKIPMAKLSFRVRNPIQIYIGAQGPKMLSLAGEIGNGVLINASHPKDLQDANKYIIEGITKANKSIEELDIAAYTSFSVDEDLKKAYKYSTRVVAFIVAGSPDQVLEKHGIDLESSKRIKESLIKGDFGTAFSQVSSEMVEAFAITGTPDVCIEKIASILKTGVSQLVVGSPVGPNIRRSINIITQKIIPHFKEK